MLYLKKRPPIFAILACAVSSCVDVNTDEEPATSLEEPRLAIERNAASEPKIIDGVTYIKPKPVLRNHDPQESILNAGDTFAESGRRLEADIRMQKDVQIEMRDGAILYADIFRPVSDEKVPAIFAWSPYGKQEGEAALNEWPNRAGVPSSATSGLQKFEAPDPAFWVAHGYAIINIDTRGSFNSDGNIRFWGDQDANDGFDAVEWVAAQPWSNGRVGFAGNSWLAIAQWFIAAKQPPHLAAIAPWEGLSDIYRDDVLRGGIPEPDFNNGAARSQSGRNLIENPALMIDENLLYNSYWEDHAADLEKVTVPAYVVGSWTNPIHVQGTFRGWDLISSADKWLRIHNGFEWPDFYEYEKDLLRFFDHYLKGENNGWEETPRVRYSILNPGGDDQVNLPAHNFPANDTVNQELYLNGAEKTLATSPVSEISDVRYSSVDGEAVFDYVFPKTTDVVGYITANLWMASSETNDADVFVYVQKIGSDGRPLHPKIMGQMWSGADGRLRASHREVDTDLSTTHRIEFRHANRQLLQPGEPVLLPITLTPLGMRWEEGQTLRLIIAGREIEGLNFGVARTINSGEHIIFTGGDRKSYLSIPIAQ